MMSGLASGLRSIVWKVTPPSPKLSPARIARTARGSRSRPTVKEAPGTSSPRTTRSDVAGRVEGLPDHERQRRTRRRRARPAHDDQGRRRRRGRTAAAGDGVDGRTGGGRAEARRSQLAHLLPADDVDEEGGADQRGDDADVELARAGPRCGRGRRRRSAGTRRSAPRTAAASGGRRRRAAGRRGGRRARRSRWARRRRSRRRRAAPTPRAATPRASATRSPSPAASSSPRASELRLRADRRLTAKPDDEERRHVADAVEGRAADAADLPGLHAAGDVVARQGDGGDERARARPRSPPRPGRA